MGVGTNLKFYIEQGGLYYNITPIRATNTLTNPFTTVSGSATVTLQMQRGVMGLGTLLRLVTLPQLAG